MVVAKNCVYPVVHLTSTQLNVATFKCFIIQSKHIIFQSVGMTKKIAALRVGPFEPSFVFFLWNLAENNFWQTFYLL